MWLPLEVAGPRPIRCGWLAQPLAPPPLGLPRFGRLLPARRAHFRYDGSFTTPPYTEDVRWCVFTSPIEASARQLALYRKLFAPNARPIQPTGDRDVVCSR